MWRTTPATVEPPTLTALMKTIVAVSLTAPKWSYACEFTNNSIQITANDRIRCGNTIIVKTVRMMSQTVTNYMYNTVYDSTAFDRLTIRVL
eukprot:m.213854 g.213854  ORF g.213854 m.213854 type:complete len:91 (+) comp33160_c1_seq3:229-501(+)